jgi:hypothetical protein
MSDLVFAPANVSGQKIEWAITGNLRWVVLNNNHRFPELQQEWKNVSTGSIEWREIPTSMIGE